MSKISNERKVTYYIGIGIMILGFVLFISVFFAVSNLQNDPFASQGPSFGNAVIGMILMIVGAIVANIGAKGAAGSGLILDPKKQREDLKPYNEAKGEMINDVVSNIDAFNNLKKEKDIEEVIKIRCKNCSSLNDEDAKFCKECGKEI